MATRRQLLGLIGAGALVGVGSDTAAADVDFDGEGMHLTDVADINFSDGTTQSTAASGSGSTTTTVESSLDESVDVLVYQSSADTVAERDGSTIYQGAAGATIQAAFDDLAPYEKLLIAPGQYDTSDVDPLVSPGGGATNENNVIEAWGARINSTLEWVSQVSQLFGLVVDGAPGTGFVVRAGQRGAFVGCRAKNCGSHGWHLGVNGGQVATQTWKDCHAASCGATGWLLDGSEDNAWVNANTFVGCTSGGHTGYGLETKGVANYNTFTQLQMESNSESSGALINSRENTFIGCHIVGNGGLAIEGGPDAARNTVLGGRYPRGIVGIDNQFGGAQMFRSARPIHFADVGGEAALTLPASGHPRVLASTPDAMMSLLFDTNGDGGVGRIRAGHGSEDMNDATVWLDMPSDGIIQFPVFDGEGTLRRRDEDLRARPPEAGEIAMHDGSGGPAAGLCFEKGGAWHNVVDGSTF